MKPVVQSKVQRKGGVWWPAEQQGGLPSDVVIDVLIPALNEERSLPLVLNALPEGWVRRVVVVNNGSTDRTAAVAREHGALVVDEPVRGYGSACLAGLAFISQNPPDILVFLDADYSDYPEELPRVVQPILDGSAELVIGSRTLGERDRGALLPQALFGNWLACTLVEIMYGYRFSDLGPFRAVSWPALIEIGMQDRDFGWTVEMQVKAARRKIAAVEVPVSYRKRIGVSKVTGTVRGSVMAGYKILSTIFLQYLEK